MNKSSEKFIVSFKNQYYDLTKFRHKHPGGINTLKGLEDTNITERFKSAPKHSSAAMYLLNEYKISNESDVVNSIKKDSMFVDQNNNNNNNEEVSSTEQLEEESMEYLVDWSKAMLPQIGKLGKNYNEWVNKPVDRHLRMFHHDYLEVLTKTPWWAVPAFWIPVIIYFLNAGYNELIANNESKIFMIINPIFGIGLWTLLEYSLHRWVFHVNVENGNKYLITFHFLIHGLHHKVPFDPYRLVFPPIPGAVLAYILYTPVPFLFNYSVLILPGAIIGYLVYDMTHFYIHYGSPTFGSYFYHMKRYHAQHHFSHHDQGFGISSPVWDNVFDTKIILRKLKYILKW